MPPGFSTEEFNALLGPRWKEGDPTDRVDPTRFARVTLAMKRIRRLTPDKQHSDQNYPYVSKAAVYDLVREALAECGLHIRTKLNKAIEVSAELDLGATRSNKAEGGDDRDRHLVRVRGAARRPGRADALGAAAARGPCRSVQSQGHLWALARKYWLNDVLLVSTEEEGAAINPEHDTIDRSSYERISRRRGGRRSRRDDAPPDGPQPPDDASQEPPAEFDPSINREEKILRGIERAGLSEAEAREAPRGPRRRRGCGPWSRSSRRRTPRPGRRRRPRAGNPAGTAGRPEARKRRRPQTAARRLGTGARRSPSRKGRKSWRRRARPASPTRR